MEERKSGLPPKAAAGSLSRKAIKQKRPVIDARRQSGATSEASNAKVSDRPKSLRDMKMINQAFSQHFIFTSLTEENTDALVESMQHFELSSGKVLFEQNEPAKYFFVLVTGKLEVAVNGKRVNYVNPGEGFGELALLHDTPRSATIRSIERSTMWGLNRKDFREAIAQVNSINYIETKTFIDSVPLL
jgi:cGMP-dependent protein kinase